MWPQKVRRPPRGPMPIYAPAPLALQPPGPLDSELSDAPMSLSSDSETSFVLSSSSEETSSYCSSSEGSSSTSPSSDGSSSSEFERKDSAGNILHS